MFWNLFNNNNDMSTCGNCNREIPNAILNDCQGRCTECHYEIEDKDICPICNKWEIDLFMEDGYCLDCYRKYKK